MPPRQTLGELELVILLALMRLGDGAHGAAIRVEIARTTGRTITPGAIYPTLDRLEQRGLVRSRIGEPLAERGGRARRHFALLPTGLTQVRQAWRQYARLTDGLEDVLLKGTTR